MSRSKKENVKIESSKFEKLVMSLIWLVSLGASIVSGVLAYRLFSRGDIIVPAILSLMTLYLFVSATETFLEFLDDVTGLL